MTQYIEWKESLRIGLDIFLRSAFLLQIFLVFQVHIRDFNHPFFLINFLEYVYVLLLC